MATSAAGQVDRGPGPKEATEATDIVVQWVREWQVSDTAPACAGVAIALRLDGQVIATTSCVVDPARNLSLAARTALLRAGRHLPADRDAVWESRVASIAVSVELAGPMIPIAVRSTTDLATAFSPGVDGVAVRLADRVEARFPSQMLASGEDGLSAARSLAAELAGDPTRALEDIEQLLELGYVFYRFRTTHMAQPAPSVGPVFLHRGGRIVAQTEITTATLVRLADGMAAHLVGRLWPGVEPYGLMGTPDPVSGRHAGMFEQPAAQAFAASALLTYAALERAPHEGARSAHDAATEIIRELAAVADGEPKPWDQPIAAAACLIAITDLERAILANGEPFDPEVTLLRERCSLRVAGLFDVDAGQFSAEVLPMAYGLVALAQVRIAQGPQPMLTRAAASAAVRGAYRNSPAEALIFQMPWLAWADMELAGADAVPPSSAAMIELRRQMWSSQLGIDTLEPADWDFAGSLAVVGGSAGLPSWQSLRPLPWVASMLAHKGLTPGSLTEGEAAQELQRVLKLARFAAQLAAGPEISHMYVRPERSLFGVRAALWDQRMPAEATAVALEGLCRVLAAADALAARTAAQNSSP
jgi:hypothetical protein